MIPRDERAVLTAWPSARGGTPGAGLNGSPPGFRRALINRDCPASTLPPRADRKRSVAGQCNGCNGSRSVAMAAVNSRAGAGCDPGRPANFFRQQHLGTLTRLPVPAQHGGQSNRGEREPNEPANQMLARLRRGLGALRLAFVGVSHVRCSNSRLRHCKLGRKKTAWTLRPSRR